MISHPDHGNAKVNLTRGWHCGIPDLYRPRNKNTGPKTTTALPNDRHVWQASDNSQQASKRRCSPCSALSPSRRALGCGADALRLAELTDSMAERNRRAILAAVNAPGEEVGASRDFSAGIAGGQDGGEGAREAPTGGAVDGSSSLPLGLR